MEDSSYSYSFKSKSETSSGGESPAPSKPPRKKATGPKKVRRIVQAVLILAVLVLFGSTCWFTVNDKQQAVVTTFGRVTSIADAGVHFKLPFGIQQVEKVDVNVYQSITLGYRDTNSGDFTLVEEESKMITGDYNIVLVEFFVEYKISDPVKYLYSSYEPEMILRNLVQSQVRNVVGSTDVDSVLTDGKEDIQRQVRELVAELLEEYDIGLMLVDAKIQDSDPPTDTVVEAFKAVETAKQQAETVVNEATAYQNEQLPAAQAEADALIQNAEYLRQARINQAIERVAMFEAMYNEYALNPEITRSRMYYEILTKLLPDIKLYILTTDSGVETMLPLEDFVNGNAQ